MPCESWMKVLTDAENSTPDLGRGPPDVAGDTDVVQSVFLRYIADAIMIVVFHLK